MDTFRLRVKLWRNVPLDVATAVSTAGPTSVWSNLLKESTGKHLGKDAFKDAAYMKRPRCSPELYDNYALAKRTEREKSVHSSASLIAHYNSVFWRLKVGSSCDVNVFPQCSSSWVQVCELVCGQGQWG